MKSERSNLKNILEKHFAMFLLGNIFDEIELSSNAESDEVNYENNLVNIVDKATFVKLFTVFDAGHVNS